MRELLIACGTRFRTFRVIGHTQGQLHNHPVAGLCSSSPGSSPNGGWVCSAAQDGGAAAGMTGQSMGIFLYGALHPGPRRGYSPLRRASSNRKNAHGTKISRNQRLDCPKPTATPTIPAPTWNNGADVDPGIHPTRFQGRWFTNQDDQHKVAKQRQPALPVGLWPRTPPLPSSPNSASGWIAQFRRFLSCYQSRCGRRDIDDIARIKGHHHAPACLSAVALRPFSPVASAFLLPK